MISMAEVSKGLFYKKVLDGNGNTTKTVPLLPKTMANLVVTEDGSTVESKLETLDNKKTYLVYNTIDEYMADYEAGLIPAVTLAIVTEK